MSGTKRLAVGGPWHGQVIEPSSDNYERLETGTQGRLIVVDGLATREESISYRQGGYVIPTVRGTTAIMPLLVPIDYDPPTDVEVLDALVMAVFGEPRPTVTVPPPAPGRRHPLLDANEIIDTVGR